MSNHTKAMLFKSVGIGVYLNYYYLIKISFILFPLAALYAIIFNREMLSQATDVGICVYYLYFQEVLARWEIESANGDKEKAKAIIRQNLTRTIVSIICLLVGIMCCYFSWINFFIYLCGGPEAFKTFVDSIIM